MSSFAVTAEKIEVIEHPNADALELAKVGGYHAVVAKGSYKSGDYAIYIPEAAVLPEELCEELGLTGRLAGAAKNRVKAIRLRGELSQGIVCRPKALAGEDLKEAQEQRRDFAAELGIKKWVADIPVHLAGDVVNGAELLSWIDIENIKRFPGVFVEGELVEATEKIHGSACLVTFDQEAGLLVSSKGLGGKGLAIVESDSNTYWRAVTAHGLKEVARLVAKEYGASSVGLFGEVYGKGIQDLGYNRERNQEVGYGLFDVKIRVDQEVRWLSRDEIAKLSSVVTLVPVLYRGPFNAELLVKLAEGKESVSGTESHLREGLVVRSIPERYSDVVGGRAIAKVVSEAYLTRGGATEYE